MVPAKGVLVRGGVVLRDALRGRSRIWYWLRSLPQLLGFGGLLLTEDIVIHDANGHEVYREGPFDQITVGTAFNRVVAEINVGGLVAFLVQRREPGEEGALVRNSGKGRGADISVVGRYLWFRAPFRRKGR